MWEIIKLQLFEMAYWKNGTQDPGPYENPGPYEDPGPYEYPWPYRELGP